MAFCLSQERKRIGSSGILPGSMDGINLLPLKITKAERLCYHIKYEIHLK